MVWRRPDGAPQLELSQVRKQAGRAGFYEERSAMTVIFTVTVAFSALGANDALALG